MRKTLTIVGLLLLSSSVLAANFGERNKWEQGWGQGQSEYAGGNRKATLYFSCDSNDKKLTYLDAKVGGQSLATYSLVIDGQPITGFGTNVADRINHQTWGKIYAALRNAKTLALLSNGQSVALPVAGLKKALPAVGSASFDCN
jgi:hypothetical protein